MGELRHIRVGGAEGLAGSEVPFLDLGSAARGPTVCLVAGVHGCEYSSMLGLRRFLRGLDETTLRGRILAVPIANLASFQSRTAFVVPHDGLNLNRCFPGDPAGSFTERLAHELFEGVIRHGDALIDLHAGDAVEALEPFTLYDASPVEERSRELAGAYGLSYRLRAERSESPIAGTSSAAAAEAGIPAIIAEAGGCGLVDERSVGLHLDGLHRVLAEVGVLPGSYPQPPPPRDVASWVWLRSPIEGWWEPAVSAGTVVRAGERLGEVSSLSGDEVSEVSAPGGGVPLFVTTSPAVAAGGLLLGFGLL
jgi:predicted deacylase